MHRFQVQPISYAIGNNRKKYTNIHSYHNGKRPKPPDPNFYLNNKSEMTKHGLMELDFLRIIDILLLVIHTLCVYQIFVI